MKVKNSNGMPSSKIKTEWNLKLLYKSPKDPRIEKDLKIAEKACIDFEKKYKNKDFTKDQGSLLKALLDYELLVLKVSGNHAPLYFHFMKHLDADNKEAEARLTQIADRFTKATNRIIFFQLKLGKIPSPIQKKHLKSPKLGHFRYYLENVFKRAKHDLSEPEEKILSLKYLPAHSMWTSGFEKLLSKQAIDWRGKEIPIDEAISTVSILPTKDRRTLHYLILEKLKSISDFAESEINAIYTDKKINDELRGFKKPYDSTLLGDEMDEKMVEAMTLAVTRLFSISHRFYKLKSKLFGLKRFNYGDRSAKIGAVKKKISFEEAIKIVKNAFGDIDEDFEAILSSYLINGQIDVYPRKGKRGGAYCASSLNAPVFVLLNHTDHMKAVMTLAHEMGHAIHAEYSKKQSPLYESVTMPVAEVASTFFEHVIFDNLYDSLSPKEKVIALHDRINDLIQTIFRQIACFNFEKELHIAVRQKGFVSKEEIGGIMNKHMKAYLGPLFDFKELDGYFFVAWPHIRDFFYVYSYAHGAIISKAMYGKYKKDKKYLSKIKEFLSAGGSKSPYDIFKSIGIDTSNPNFWKEGLKEIEEDIKKLEKLTG